MAPIKNTKHYTTIAGSDSHSNLKNIVKPNTESNRRGDNQELGFTISIYKNVLLKDSTTIIVDSDAI